MPSSNPSKAKDTTTNAKSPPSASTNKAPQAKSNTTTQQLSSPTKKSTPAGKPATSPVSLVNGAGKPNAVVHSPITKNPTSSSRQTTAPPIKVDAGAKAQGAYQAPPAVVEQFPSISQQLDRGSDKAQQACPLPSHEVLPTLKTDQNLAWKHSEETLVDNDHNRTITSVSPSQRPTLINPQSFKLKSNHFYLNFEKERSVYHYFIRVKRERTNSCVKETSGSETNIADDVRRHFQLSGFLKSSGAGDFDVVGDGFGNLIATHKLSLPENGTSDVSIVRQASKDLKSCETWTLEIVYKGEISLSRSLLSTSALALDDQAEIKELEKRKKALSMILNSSVVRGLELHVNNDTKVFPMGKRMDEIGRGLGEFSKNHRFFEWY